MAYILGEREFWGLPFKVSPAVLVPRPDSETLIEAALALMPDRTRPGVFSISAWARAACCSPCCANIPTRAASAWRSRTRRWRWPRPTPSPGRGRRGRGSLPATGGSRIGAADGRAVRSLVSNPPYIESRGHRGPDAGGGRFEPKLALDGGPDGLGPIARLPPRRPTWSSRAAVARRSGEGKPLKYRGFFRCRRLDAEALEGPGRHRPRRLRIH